MVFPRCLYKPSTEESRRVDAEGDGAEIQRWSNAECPEGPVLSSLTVPSKSVSCITNGRESERQSPPHTRTQVGAKVNFITIPASVSRLWVAGRG